MTCAEFQHIRATRDPRDMTRAELALYVRHLFNCPSCRSLAESEIKKYADSISPSVHKRMKALVDKCAADPEFMETILKQRV